MILNIRVIPKSSRNLIKKENDSLKAYLTKPAHNGLANKQLIELLANHLKVNPVRDTISFCRLPMVSNGVKKYQIKIIKGEKARNKVIEIDARVDTGKI